MDLLTLASRHRDWLASRQTTIATNIANANTPRFKSLQIQPFKEVLKTSSNSVATALSHPRHLAGGNPDQSGKIGEREDAVIVTHSGNSVNVEDELLAAGAVKREYALNTSVTRTFRRMIMAGLRG